ncbi:MAG: aldehyde ferredoxin oxidoreductase family protein [Planctomycetes bacterium]|nr:aldehyde ferredoxin oxidoreductase family protein [Planctomycetota bacterium]
MPFGYHNKILRADLTEGKTSIEEPGDLVYRKYMGGSSLALYYLLAELPKGTDPLSPDNVLIFAPSIITGTQIAGGSRYTVAARSPLTGAYGEAEAGGWWGPELKRAGFDAIIIKGKSPKPVYLWIHDGEAEIRDASQLWGKLTGEVQDAIHGELGDTKVRIAQTGPAGEKLVRYACIINELRHANGRTGMGAVMGSKNLRAIAVRGTQKVPVADEDGAKQAQRHVRENHTKQPGDLSDLGTPRLVEILNESGILPTRNFHDGEFDGASNISGKKMKDTVLAKTGTCYACPVACKREVAFEDDRFKVEGRYGGPEYETLASLGSFCCVDDLKAVCAGHQLCNEHCMDTISTGVAIAFAMECYENGILTKEDTDGIELAFGNADAMVAMVEKIGKREGFGDILAEGIQRAAEKIGKGAEKYAHHIKGQEVPMHDPRGKTGSALSFATSPTGADHVEAPHDPFYTGLNPKGGEPLSLMGMLEPADPLDMSPKKVELFYHGQLVWSLYNCIGMCNFAAAPLGPVPLRVLCDHVAAVTGWDTSLFELFKVAERSSVMARAFNYREGFTKSDDYLPKILHRPLENGKLKGHKIDTERFQEFLKTYYEAMGWNPETGYPTRGKLAQLDLLWLEDVV